MSWSTPWNIHFFTVGKAIYRHQLMKLLSYCCGGVFVISLGGIVVVEDGDVAVTPIPPGRDLGDVGDVGGDMRSPSSVASR
jgi:hypothetical protein